MNFYRKTVFKLKQILKLSLFFIIYYSGILQLLILVLKRFRKRHCAAILFYHRFSKQSPDLYQLPHLDIREFEKQMRHVNKYYTVISMDEIAEKLSKSEGFSSPSIAITIDDGYLSNYTLAYPILKNHNIPATIYLTTGLIGTNKSLWVDDLQDMLFTTKEREIFFPEVLGDEILDISSQLDKQNASFKLFNIMQSLDHLKKIQAMDSLKRKLCLQDDNHFCADRKMLNWGEVTEMVENNICFGAHTATHPTLSKMDFSDAKQEIMGSIKEVEQKVGKKVSHFAIPNGKNEDFSGDLKNYCRHLGLETVVSTEPGLVSAQSDIYFLKRILPPPPIHVFACQLAIYMFFKKT